MTKVYKTKRLFYGKWPYKIETHIPGGSFLHRWGATEARKFCLGISDTLYRPNFSEEDKIKLLSYIDAYLHVPKNDVQIRAEYHTLNYYAGDEGTYKTIKSILKKWVVCLTEPGSQEELEVLLNSKSKKVICNKLPYDKYRYKLTIKPSMPVAQREKFLEWLKQFPDSFHPTESTKKWLSGEHSYLPEPYIYIEDSKQITFVKLFLGNSSGRCEEFVVRDTQKAGK